MSDLFTLSGDWVDPLGRILLHSLWQGALIALVYRLLHAAISSSRPALRVWAGELCLLACIALPVMTELWPAAAAEPLATTFVSNAGAELSASAVAAGDDMALGRLRAVLVAVWMAGVLVLGMRAAWRWVGLRGVVLRAQPVLGEWRQRLQALCRDGGVHAEVRWCESAEVDSPMLVGWLRPVILFPLGLTLRLPPAQVELLLVHELAHIRRADFLFNAVQLLVETMLFFHPAVHWIARSVRHDRELACDDWVAAQRAQRTEYARALLAVAELRHAAAPLVLAASGGVLLQRIRRIVGEDVVDERSGASLRVLLVAAASMLLLLVGIQRAERDWQAIKLPVSEALVRTLRQVGVDPVVVPLPTWQREDLAPVPWMSTPEADGMSAPETLAPIDPSPLAATGQVPASHEVELAADLDIGQIVPALAAPTGLAVNDSAGTRRIVAAPLPYYPRRARQSGIEGWVDLDYEIAADGRVRDIRVLESQPARVFDIEAIEALQQWRFAGGDVERRVQRFDFTLSDEAGNKQKDSAECERPTGTRICRAPRA